MEKLKIIVTLSTNQKSVLRTFTQRVIFVIIFSSLIVAGLMSYFSYSNFATHSKELESEYIKSQKDLLRQEIESVERIIKYNRSKLNQTIHENIKEHVYIAHDIATHIYERNKNNKSKSEIITLIKDALRGYRFFNGRGYVFIDSLQDYTNVLHPIIRHIEGTSVLKSKNHKGIFFAKNLLNVAKEKGEGYYSYDWVKPNEEGQFSKVSFVKKFKPYNWSIGTGDYLVEVEREIQKEILERIGEIRFGKEGYIFVVNYDGDVMMNRGNRSLIGKNILHVTDSNGVRVAEEVIKLAQTPGWDGYFNYTWKKLSSDKIAPKVAYHKMVQDWGWYYGAGVYLDDVDGVIAIQRSQLRSELFLNLSLIALSIIIALFFIIKLARKNSKQLYFDISKLLGFFSNLSTKSEPLHTENFIFTEFKELGDSANEMLEKQKVSEEKRLVLERTVQHTQKMDTVSQMVGGIAHDFNNLLSAILGYGELLESKLSDQPKLEGFCSQINIAGKRGSKLTRKLLSLSRTTDTEAEQCDINNLLNGEREFLKKSLTAKIDLNFILNKNVWLTKINKNDCEDAILNLCVNAMHAMKDGQQDSVIEIKTDNFYYDGENTLDLEAGDYVKISILDNGLGMEEIVRERLFEPFFTTRETGTGLGLSQVYNFIKRSQGAIQVASTLGKGSEFQLFFPRYKEDEHAETVAVEQDKSINTKGSETILIVDDEDALRSLCTELLSAEGYNILQAEHGIDALAILENEKVDLLLSDVIMPNMDGNLLAERVKKLYPHIKIQLISGYMKDDQIYESNLDLFDNILRKPVEATTLLTRVRELLDS